MQKFETLEDAIDLATLAHKKQKDKAGLKYIEHPLRVLATVQAQGAMPYVQMAAVLHDVCEDTKYTHDMLLELGFSEAVVKLTKLLDRGHSKVLFGNQILPAVYRTQEELKVLQDTFYYEEIKKNQDALRIKLADIQDNLLPWRLNYLDEETQKRLRKKYHFALEILNPKPKNHGLVATPIDFGPTFNPFIPGGY